MYRSGELIEVERGSEFTRRHFGLALKQLAKTLRMLKAQFVGDFADGQPGCRKFFFRFFNKFLMDILLCILPNKRTEQVT